MNSDSYEASQGDANPNLQNFTGTSVRKSAPIRTNPVQAAAGCSPRVPIKKENPGAAATASGANVEITKARPEYLDRLESARNLQAAIEACDPAIAAIIMDRELNALRIGEPGAALLTAMDDARSWAEWATPAEHKAYCLTCYNAMPEKDQAGFLFYVKGRAAA
jgi:hypothetical protein